MSLLSIYVYHQFPYIQLRKNKREINKKERKKKKRKEAVDLWILWALYVQESRNILDGKKNRRPISANLYRLLEFSSQNFRHAQLIATTKPCRLANGLMVGFFYGSILSFCTVEVFHTPIFFSQQPTQFWMLLHWLCPIPCLSEMVKCPISENKPCHGEKKTILVGVCKRDQNDKSCFLAWRIHDQGTHRETGFRMQP